MAQNDIYGSKERYEKFLANLNDITKKPKSKKRIYYCKNPGNILYFQKLAGHFEMKNISYIRRVRMFHVLKLLTYVTEKNLEKFDRDDINKMVAYGHTTHKTINSKRDFIKDLKCMWRVLFPERDHQARVDETLTPYVVRHLSRKIDRSKEKRRNDKLTWEEFQKLLNFFSEDEQMQAYLMFSVESLGRPQEILYTKIRDYEFHDNFARVMISEHGKEGTGVLQCIDSYPYIVEWYRKHPLKDDPNAFFFINKGKRKCHEQLKNNNINGRLRHALKLLAINKSVTCYSLKRNGVTFARLRGDSDLDIQHRARWTSTKQLKIYDMSTQEDAFKLELQKRGLGITEDGKQQTSATKTCQFCETVNGFTAEFCNTCKRPLDRKKIQEMAEFSDDMVNNQLFQRFARLEKMFERVVDRKTI